jgi:tetratricopeptide (TPR) repeat protein
VSSEDSAFRTRLLAAIDLSDAGNWTNAQKEFDRLVAAHPNEAAARFERAMVLLNLNRDAEAIVDLEQVLKLAPEYPGAMHWYAIALAGQGRYMLAAEVRLRELQALPPEHWSANGQPWADCADYFLKAGAPDRALAALDIYFEQYEEKQRGKWMYSPAPFRLRARALLVLGRLDEALVAAERAGDDFTRLRALAAMGQTAQALAELQRLKPTFERTAPYNEAVAELRRLGLKVD